MLPTGNLMTALIHQKHLSLEFIKQDINEITSPYAHITNRLYGETKLFTVVHF
ncbi:hypothetical protein D3C86_2156690 [compost metagenome]